MAEDRFDPVDYWQGLPDEARAGDGEEPIEWDNEPTEDDINELFGDSDRPEGVSWHEWDAMRQDPLFRANEDRMMAECYYEMELMERQEIRDALEKGLRNGKHPLPEYDDEWPDMPLWEQWFHFIKAVFCFAFGWGPMEHHGYYPDEIDIHTESTGDAYNWDSRTVVVGKGIFRNWFVTVRADGDSSY